MAVRSNWMDFADDAFGGADVCAERTQSEKVATSVTLSKVRLLCFNVAQPA
jgi:hypothetical protein